MKTAVRAESFLYLSTFIVIYLLQRCLQTIVRLVSLSVLHFNIFSKIIVHCNPANYLSCILQQLVLWCTMWQQSPSELHHVESLNCVLLHWWLLLYSNLLNFMKHFKHHFSCQPWTGPISWQIFVQGHHICLLGDNIFCCGHSVCTLFSPNSLFSFTKRCEWNIATIVNFQWHFTNVNDTQVAAILDTTQ